MSALGEVDWLRLQRQHNILARPGRPSRVASEAIGIQRLYLDAAARRAGAHPDPDPWVERTLRDWSEVLDAYERGDASWLGRRLDAFIKHELYTHALCAAGCSWSDLPGRPDLLDRLALLDQAYHAFCDPASPFEQLERSGLLDHRVGPRIAPGAEPAPFVPETTTRARPRALFLRDHAPSPNLDYAPSPGLVMDWSALHDPPHARRRPLADPFATAFAPWERTPQPEMPPPTQDRCSVCAPLALPRPAPDAAPPQASTRPLRSPHRLSRLAAT